MKTYHGTLFALASLTSSLFDSCSSARVRRNRDEKDLAPELNKNHPHVYRRQLNDILKYTVGFYEDTPSNEILSFQTEFEEFIVANLPHFDVVQLEIPTALTEDVILDIRAKTYVEVVENVLTLRSHDKHRDDIHWNKARIGAVQTQHTGTGSQQFYGSGYGAYIYIIDSGVDDHL
eukprot:Awhi_evm1s8587